MTSIGTKIDENKVDNIKTCETTAAQILKWFGKPYSKGSLSGFKTYNYAYASIAGGSNLTVYFNKKGRVIEYALNSTGTLTNIQDKCSK